VTNTDAAAHTSGFAALLSAQLTAPVRWRASLGTMAAMGATTFIELGPGKELSGMVKRTVETAVRANVATPEDLEALALVLPHA
jgi:[acyl-carrier-protein] S-malonyltransferase